MTLDDSSSHVYANNENSSINNNVSMSHRRTKENSDKYFIGLFWLFVCVKLRYDFYIFIPCVVLVWRVLKHVLSLAFVAATNMASSSGKFELFKLWFVRRRDILAPRPFLLLVKLFRKGDHKCIQIISSSMDTIVTAFIIIILIFAVICSAIILCIQVQSESTQLISFGSNILNEQLYAKPEWHQWLPEKERLNKIYHSSMKNFHSYGREWLSRNLKSALDQSFHQNNTDHVLLEAQILEQWDNLYAYLSHQSIVNASLNNYSQMAPMSVPPKITPLSQTPNETLELSTHRTVGTQTPKTPWFWTNYKHLAVLLKDNLGVLMSIGDSVYLIVKGNLNLITTILWTVVSTLLSSGFALANFFVSFLVYMSVVFYLLSSSRYKPLEWLSEFKLIEQSQLALGLSKAIEDSIRSVFVASLKMAAFFGLYTYTVNCLFSVSIVFVPSIVAALVAFLPLLGTYWVAVPGVLELWLVQNRPLAALFFAVAHLLPALASVDKAIYSEIKAGHPYLTGLSFAGGVYCLGLEGALIGPIVLCLLIVIARMIGQANLSQHFKSYQQLTRTPSVEKD